MPKMVFLTMAPSSAGYGKKILGESTKFSETIYWLAARYTNGLGWSSRGISSKAELTIAATAVRWLKSEDLSPAVIVALRRVTAMQAQKCRRTVQPRLNAGEEQ
jgi:hypothetical protein